MKSDSAEHPIKPRTRSWISERWAMVLLCSILTIAVSAVSHPIKSHEAFVLQTSREMIERNEWLVPYYNGALRLTKPPVSYWITMAVSRLDPFHKDVLPWHGRTASVLAGLGMAFLILFIGSRIYGRRVGLLAAMLLVTSFGYTSHGRNARPDFLYAFFCAAQLFAWVEAWRSKDGSKEQRWKSWGGWVAAGLATLTKGPQIPLLFIVGLLFHLVRTKQGKRILKVLRPISGLLISLAIAAPWWFLLQSRLLESGQSLADTQLSGTKLHEMASIKELFSFYYVEQVFTALRPWGLMLPFLLIWRKKRSLPKNPSVLLIEVSVIVLLGLTVFGHYRKQYPLPLYPVFFLLMAAFADSTSVRFSDAKWSRLLQSIAKHFSDTKWSRVLAVIEKLGLAICIGVMIWQSAYLAILPFLAFFGLLALLRKRELRDQDWTDHPFARLLVHAATIVALMHVGLGGFTIWERGDCLTRTFYEDVGNTVRREDLLAANEPTDDALVYYGNHRGTISYSGPEDLKKSIGEGQRRQRVFVVLPQSELPPLEKTFRTFTKSALVFPKDPDKNLVFVEVVLQNSVAIP